jgi:hypothetical protein
VAITGSDSPFIQFLFKADCSHAIVPEPGTSFPTANNIKVEIEKNLIPLGISKLLRNNVRNMSSLNETDKIRGIVLGLRGARAESLVVGYESVPGIYRGTFVRVIAGKLLKEDAYEIMFDNDGEKEILDPVEMYGTYQHGSQEPCSVACGTLCSCSL